MTSNDIHTTLFTLLKRLPSDYTDYSGEGALGGQRQLS